MKRKLQTWKQLEQNTRSIRRAIEEKALLEKRPLIESELWDLHMASANKARYQRYQAIGLPNPNGMP